MYVKGEQKKRVRSTMQVAIDKDIYQKAESCAKRKGVNLNIAIEMFLINFIDRNTYSEDNDVPEEFLSLLRANTVAV